MALESGQIIGTDLSPNANILGTQIADKTLQLRNFAAGTFPASVLQITSSGTTSIPSTTSLNTVSIAHGLSYQPFLVAFAQSNIFGAGQTYLLPHLVTATNSAVTGAFVISVEFGAYTDSSNINFYIRSAGVSANATITYFLVKASATG